MVRAVHCLPTSYSYMYMSEEVIITYVLEGIMMRSHVN